MITNKPPHTETFLRLTTTSDRPQKRLRRLSGRLGLQLSERKFFLALGDLIILSLALWLYVMIIRGRGLDVTLFWTRTYLFLVIIAIWIPISLFSNLYDLTLATDAVRSSLTGMLTALITSGIYILIPYWSPGLPERRLYIFILWGAAAIGIGTWRYLYSVILVQPIFQRRALVVGAGSLGQYLGETVQASGRGKTNIIYNLVGFVDDDPQKAHEKYANIPVLGNRDNLVHLVEVLRIDELIVAISNTDSIESELFHGILECWKLGVSVRTMAQVFEELTGRVPVEYVGRDLYVLLPMAPTATQRFYSGIRRLIEMLIALGGCLFVAVIAPVIWLANRLSSPGDLFYFQERVGQSGTVFQVAKFRTMVMNAEQMTGAVWASQEDTRITKIGRLLRPLRLDETPQFWNILKGEMSLIGPRPERPSIVQKLAQTIPFYEIRHAVRPGLTGWAQVRFRYGASVEDTLIKLQYDLYYIKKQSVYLDVQILLDTIKVILRMEGR